MNKVELLNQLKSKFNNYFGASRYDLVSEKSDVLNFSKTTSNGNSQGVIIGISSLNKKHRLNYYIFNTYQDLRSSFYDLSKKSDLLKTIKFADHDFTSSYERLNNINAMYYLPKIQTEEDLQDNIQEIQSYLESTLFPMLEKYEDLTELHKAINGDDFWETDWRKPFSLGGNFEYKRLIVAHLADISDEEFDQVVEKQRAIILEKTKGEYGEDFKKVLEIQDELVRLLKA